MKAPNQKVAAVFVIGVALFSMMACRNRSVKIASFTVSPSTSFTVGQTAQLCYELVNAVAARIDPDVGQLKDITKSCLKVEPRQTTTYKLSATGRNGTPASTEITLNVAALPPLANITMFEVKRDGTAAGPGSPAELCYEVNGANNLHIKPDVGNVEPVDKGCRTVKPAKTTTYELAATGTDNQTVTKEATVKVVQPAARIVRFDLSSENIRAGEKVRICYQVEDAASAYIANLDYNVKVGPAECIDVQPPRSRVYTLAARNLDGETVRKELRVNVEQPPVTVDFRAVSTEVEKGNGTVLQYRISNAARAQISFPGKVDNLTNPQGEYRITPARTTTYTLTAQDPDGKPTSQSVTVNVVPPRRARIFKFEPGQQTIGPGQQATLCYGVTWGSTVSLYSELLNSTRELESSENKCISVAPRSTDVYTLTATGPDRDPVIGQARVIVSVPPPSIQFFARSEREADRNILIARGDRAQLCYGMTNVREAQITPGFGRVEVRPTNCLDLGELGTTTTYTLSATGFDGAARTAQVTVRVYPPPQILRFEIHPNDRRFLCYQFTDGARAEITPQIGVLRNQQGCVPLPSTPNPSYTLTVHGYGNVQPAVRRFPR